jgi:ribosomal protein L2
VVSIEYDQIVRPHCFVELCRWREAVYSGSRWFDGWLDGAVRVNSEVRPGNALPLSSMPLGTTIHANIELKVGKVVS